MRRAGRIAGIALVVAASGAAGTLVLEGRPHRAFGGEAVLVTVPSGASTRDIAGLLEEAGVIRFPRLFSLRARLGGAADRLHAGEYRFDRALSPAEVLSILVRGSTILYPAMVPEGLSLAETAGRLADQGWSSRDDLVAAFRDATPVLELDPRATDLEGYLFPDTYLFPRGAEAKRIASAMVDRFRRAMAEAGWPGDGSRDLRDVVILASLVEKETAVPGERSLIAGVFAERLRRGWRLECDPTVRYALDRDGRLEGDRPLSRSDLAYESPYNTYRAGGLPPGPICSPGAESLLAALKPDPTRALFFVALGDGSGAHAFASTLPEHLRNVARYRQRREARTTQVASAPSPGDGAPTMDAQSPRR